MDGKLISILLFVRMSVLERSIQCSEEFRIVSLSLLYCCIDVTQLFQLHILGEDMVAFSLKLYKNNKPFVNINSMFSVSTQAPIVQ